MPDIRVVFAVEPSPYSTDFGEEQMRDESNLVALLNSLSVYEIVARWRLASAYLQELATNSELGDRALRTLVNRDVPLLLNQIKGLKPELWLSDQEPPGIPDLPAPNESQEAKPPETKAPSKKQ